MDNALRVASFLSQCDIKVFTKCMPSFGIQDLETKWKEFRKAIEPNLSIVLDTWHYFRGIAEDILLTIIPDGTILDVHLTNANLKIKKEGKNMKKYFLILVLITSTSVILGQSNFDEYDHRSLTIDGTKIHYRVAGSGKPILLMHGWLGSSYTWRKVAPLLVQEGYKVIIPDMKGYGDSDKPERGYDALSLAKEMRVLLKKENTKEKVHVVGWDMGALVAYIYAATFTSEVASLTYIDEPLPSVNIHKLSAFSKENYGGYWHFGFNRSPNLPEMLIDGKEREFFRYLHGLMLVNKEAISEKDLEEYLRTYKGKEGIKGSNGWYRDLLETTDQFASAIKKGKLKIPILAVGGQFGTPYTKSQMKGIISNKIQGGIIPNCGHMVAEERPLELFAMMKEFLK